MLKLTRHAAPALVALANAATFAPPAHAQWSVISLHPSGAVESMVWGGASGQQVGSAPALLNADRATLWLGSPTSRVDLHPAPAEQSVAYGTDGTQHVGYATLSGVPRAWLWTGTSASWVDLHPAGATESMAWSAGGGQQVGYAAFGGAGEPRSGAAAPDPGSVCIRRAHHGPSPRVPTERIRSGTLESMMSPALRSGAAPPPHAWICTPAALAAPIAARVMECSEWVPMQWVDRRVPVSGSAQRRA